MTQNTHRFLLTILLTAALSACAPLQKNSMRAFDNTKRELSYLGNRVKGYFEPYHPSAEEPPVLPSSYCYRTMSDILCYRDPQPGAEERLVGYQEPPLAQQQRRETAESAAPAPVTPVQTASASPPAQRLAPASAPPPAAKTTSSLDSWKSSVKSQPARAAAKADSAKARQSYNKKPTEVSPPPTVKSLSASPEALREAPLFTIAGQ